MTATLERILNVRRDEVAPVLAAGFFFCILTALMVLRPAREALGVWLGREQQRAAERTAAELATGRATGPAGSSTLT